MRNLKQLKIWLINIFLFWSGALWATNSGSVGAAAERLMTPTEIITKLMLVACYILGVILIVMAVAQYKQHRESPKLVPLTTPIMLVILGVICCLIPYWSTITESFSAVEQAKRQGKQDDRGSLPTPPVLPKQAGPGTYLAPQQNQAPQGGSYQNQGGYDNDSGY